MRANIKINFNGIKIKFKANIKIKLIIQINFKETSIHATMFKDITLKNKIIISQASIKIKTIFKTTKK